MVQKPENVLVEVEKPVDISIGRKSWANLQESAWMHHQNPSFESIGAINSRDSTSEPRFIGFDYNKVIQLVQAPKSKKNSWNESLCNMIKNNIFCYLRPTRLLMSVCAFLMVPLHGFKDKEDMEEDVERCIDSGIGSNIREPVLYGPGSGLNLEVDSPPGILESNLVPVLSPSTPPQDQEGVPIPHHPILRHLLPRYPIPHHPLPRYPGAEERNDDVVAIPRNLVESLVYPDWINTEGLSLLYDVRPGSKQNLLNLVSSLGRAAQDTGLFLREFVHLYNIGTKGVDSFNMGVDYVRLDQFSTGRDVFLCKVAATGHRFVTKMVPLEEMPMPARGDNSVQRVTRLRHRQQVELVLGLQDYAPWVAKVHGVVKRSVRGRAYGEIFMEYCEGGTMKDNLLILRSLTLRAKWRLSKNILEIVGQLHQQTIIHGDLKPDNICFRGDLRVVLIDFEAGKHPLYEPNKRATCLYLAPWIRNLGQSDFDCLKTMDLWAVGMILLDVVFGRLLWETEYRHLLVCDTCHTLDGRCLAVQHKLLCLLDTTYPRGLIPYLPAVHPEDDPLQKRLALLIRGLLSTHGPRAQLSVEDAQEALLDDTVLIQILKNGGATTPPLVVKHGITLQKFMNKERLKPLKDLHPDLRDGMWFTCEKRRGDGRVKEYVIQKNHPFTESCVLHVYSPI